MAKDLDIRRLISRLEYICTLATKFESEYAADLAAVHPRFQDSARNLLHYLALRYEDLYDLQEQLAVLGLSSLGRCERNVLATIRAVLQALHRIADGNSGEWKQECEPLKFRDPQAERHKEAILGLARGGRDVRIMVTLPSEAGDNPSYAASLIDAGMDVARINCGHDTIDVWTRMIENVRNASIQAGRECRIAVDLAGPKLRTGDLLAGPRVVHIRPKRDPMGRVIAPRRVRLVPDDTPWHGTKSAIIPVPRECIDFAGEDDEIRFKDTRGKKRSFKVISKDDKGAIVETWRGAYIATGTRLRLIRRESGEKLSYRVGKLPSIERPLLLRPGHTLILTREKLPGTPATEDAEGNVLEVAHIPCRQPEVFAYVAKGDPVWLNDGKIGGTVRAASEDQLEIEVTKAKPTGSRLRGDRGINFPQSDIQLPGLTKEDRDNIGFVAENADAIGLSFVRTSADVVLLQDELKKCTERQPGLIIKIETEQGFRNLPKLLLTAMRSYPAGVMIARGDLAVECGWERLAELQEEILWLCEAAHLPVMWATEVLEHEAKKGQPSRAEITDAAMSQRADCVMLNKGPHIIAAIRMLDNILRRMQGHQYKKTARLQRLSFSATD